MTLAADARLEASGLLGFLVPRFALKTGARVTVLFGDAAALEEVAGAGQVDAMLAPLAVADRLTESGAAQSLRPAFHSEDPAEGGAFYVVVLAAASAPELGAKFADWLTSGVGKRTVEQFSEGSEVDYRPGALPVETPVEKRAAGDAVKGEKLALVHCGRCHVVSDRNRFAGIGSTPSFAAMRGRTDWQVRFRNFFAENPHPSFTQVAGVTPPFDPMKPPHLAPVEITLDDLDAIMAYAASLAPKDLGAEIRAR